jgi:2-polyprenyl-3-methyl-5-hydroxy-6-metoxy-1,4-benzoquinol methylase
LSSLSDRAGRTYWDGVWTAHTHRRLPDPLSLTHVEQSFARIFDAALSDLPRPAKLLEIGCANSIWLPYFARKGFRVVGIDYSQVGCEQTMAGLVAARVDVEVVCCDAFSPPARLTEEFDVVFTLGVVEHFDDTAASIAAFARFLQPGGILLTVVPNVRGANGLVQRLVNPRVLDMHVPLTPGDLQQAQRSAGLTEVHAGYLIPSNFGVLNLNGLDMRARSTRAKAVLVRNLSRVSRAVWKVDRIRRLPATRVFAGYIVATARKAT